MAKQGVYHLLKKDSLLKNEDPYLQIFADSVALSNMGKLRNINNHLAGEKPDFKKADAILKSLGKTNDVEKKLAEVYEMMIESNDTAYTPNQIHKLQKIAALCPYEFGSGVYSARAILSKFDSASYFNECEMPTGGKNKALAFTETAKQNVYVYPNPANDKLSILINGETGQVAYFEVYDLTGKLIASKQLTANTINEISTAEIVSGLYFYSIKANNVLIDSGKLSIIR